jgi:hypothetical protein
MGVHRGHVNGRAAVRRPGKEESTIMTQTLDLGRFRSTLARANGKEQKLETPGRTKGGRVVRCRWSEEIRIILQKFA